jgi:TetR/AcrR family transcriptional regulator, transcriptional repressor for nem operon
MSSPEGVITARTRAAQKTREHLIDTGLALAETTGLDGLSVNALVEAAGVSKGTFFHHFGDRTSYLVALHRYFHDRIFDEVQSAVATMQPGSERLELVSSVYLDACLQDRGVRALILEARGLLDIQAEVRRRNAANTEFVAIDFIAMGWDHPRSAAQLWVAAAAECALIELEACSADPAARAALRQFTQPGRLRTTRSRRS